MLFRCFVTQHPLFVLCTGWTKKKVCSQKTKIGHGRGFLKKKTMTNKIKKFLYTLLKLFYFIGHGIFFQKKPTMADFRFLRTHFFFGSPCRYDMLDTYIGILED